MANGRIYFASPRIVYHCRAITIYFSHLIDAAFVECFNSKKQILKLDTHSRSGDGIPITRIGNLVFYVGARGTLFQHQQVVCFNFHAQI